MRVFYLHLTRVDFNISGNGQFWQSDSIDLYYNGSYQNYSLVRSLYGLGAIQPMMGGSTPNNVWVGMKYADPYPIDTDLYDDIDPYDSWEIYAGSTPNEPIVFTDSGFILGDRFVDTSGPINIVNFNVVCPEYSSDLKLSLFQTESPTSIFPEEWQETNTDITAAQGLFVNNAQRYIMFQLKWNYDPGDVDLYLRVEVGPPVMSPRYTETTNILGKLPSWMAMSELGEGNPNSATPQLATNTSTGGKLVNALSGEWLDDLRQQITYRQLQLFISTADIRQKAWAWKTSITTDWAGSFEGDENICVIANDLNEFLQAQDTEDIVFWDEAAGVVYSNKLYKEFEVNFVQYPQESAHIWNSFDDLGQLVNLYRLPGEGNVSFKQRILDVYINPPGAGLLSFENAVRRELNLWQFYGSTPNSSYVGATPHVLEVPDILQDPHYSLPNGLPTTKMIRLVNYLAKQYPTTWGEFSWNAAFADLTDDNYSGYSVLPEIMDATPWTKSQYGVGDLQDLVVYPPTNNTGPHDFDVKFNIQGKAQQANTFYAPLALNLNITANGAKDIYNNPTTSTWLTVEFTQYSSATVSYYSFQLSSISDINNMPGATPTPASVAALRIFDPDGGTNANITLFNTVTGRSINGRLFTTDIASVKLYPGQWDSVHSTWINVPTPTDYIAWFSNSSTTTLHNGGPAFLEVDNNAATPSLLPPLTVLMQSTQVFHANDTWNAETIPVSAIINNSPTGQKLPATVVLPNLNWDKYITSGQSLKVTIEDITIQKPDGTIIAVPIPDINFGTFSATLYDSHGSVLSTGSLFTGNSYSVNLVNALSAATLKLDLSGGLVASGLTAYPIVQNTTFYFTAEQKKKIIGQVDENGPWIGGFAPAAGNVNYLYGSYSFGLGDFHLPTFSFPTSNPVQSIITSINVKNYGDDAVIVWLNNNSVVQESDGRFGPFSLHVRLNPQPSPQWNPLIHSGTYFEENQESYYYVDPIDFVTHTATDYFTLPSLVQQGAPVLGFAPATPTPTNALQQVAFFSATPPYNLTLINTETVTGNYSDQLFAAYPNIKNIVVNDITDPNDIVPIAVTSNSIHNNVITVASPSFTTIDNIYQLQYEVINSFYVDNSYQGGWPPLFDGTTISSTPDYTQSPQAVVVTNASTRPKQFIYEGAAFQSATPVNVALSPFYTPIEEGFIFLSNEDYPFDHVILEFSSQTLRQDGDYIVVTLRSYDIYGNPKPNVSLTLQLAYCYFGFDSTDNTITVTTNEYGYANFMINSFGAVSVANEAITDTLSIVANDIHYQYNQAIRFNETNVTFDGLAPISYSVLQEFTVTPKYPTNPRTLRGTVAHPSILSDGYNTQLVYGILTDLNHIPIADATVNWVKGRTNYDLFAAGGSPAAQGVAVTATNGSFQVGPFYSDVVPGYWLMSLSMQDATPSVGDIVYWLEYPGPLQNIVEIVGLPDQVVQLATPVTAFPPYNAAWEHPVYYNNAEPVTSATPNYPLNWIPPTWFPLPVFDQWEYNMFQANPGSVTQDWADYLYQNLPPNIDYEF